MQRTTATRNYSTQRPSRRKLHLREPQRRRLRLREPQRRRLRRPGKKTWFRGDPGVLRSSAKERVRERGRYRPELRSPACIAVEVPSPSVLPPARINPWKSGLSLGCEFGWGRRVQPHRSADPACKVHFLLVPPPHVRVVLQRETEVTCDIEGYSRHVKV